MATDNRRPAFDATRLDWDKGDGLLPVIVQDAATLRVLMLGYMIGFAALTMVVAALAGIRW